MKGMKEGKLRRPLDSMAGSVATSTELLEEARTSRGDAVKGCDESSAIRSQGEVEFFQEVAVMLLKQDLKGLL
jgi:hypothetical protein